MNVRDKIAKAVSDGVPTEYFNDPVMAAHWRNAVAGAVVAAVRAMSPAEQAELIGGETKRATSLFDGRPRRVAQAVGPWREVTP